MLRLHLFGRLAVSRQEDGSSGQPTPLRGRPSNVMAYLALARGKHFPRQQLIDDVWADEAADVSAGTLNTVLWRLRKLIEVPPLEHGQVIASDRFGGIGFHRDAPVELDIDEFARSVLPVLAKPLDRLSSAELDSLRRGVELYTADVLSDINDEWALRERERYRRHFLNALGRLMQASSLCADFPGAIRYAQLILDHDALREDVHRELMHFFVQNGQRALALRQFEVCRAALKRELAIVPMPETIALYQGIARSAMSESPGTPLVIQATPLAHVDLPSQSPRDLVQTAREWLAEADLQLQRVLPRL